MATAPRDDVWVDGGAHPGAEAPARGVFNMISTPVGAPLAPRHRFHSHFWRGGAAPGEESAPLIHMCARVIVCVCERANTLLRESLLIHMDAAEAPRGYCRSVDDDNLLRIYGEVYVNVFAHVKCNKFVIGAKHCIGSEAIWNN